MLMLRICFLISLCISTLYLIKKAESCGEIQWYDFSDHGSSEFNIEILRVHPAKGQKNICERPIGQQNIRFDDELDISIHLNNLTYHAFLHFQKDHLVSHNNLLEFIRKRNMNDSFIPKIFIGTIFYKGILVGNISTNLNDDGMNGNCQGNTINVLASFNIGDNHYIINPRRKQTYKRQNSNVPLNYYLFTVETTNEKVPFTYENKFGLTEVQNQVSRKKNHGMRLLRRQVPIGGVSSIPGFTKLYIDVVVDESFIASFVSQNNMLTYMANVFHVTDEIYSRTFGFGLKVTRYYWPEDFDTHLKNPLLGTLSYNEMLNKFLLSWKIKNYTKAHAVHIFTNTGDGRTLGLAYTSAFCSNTLPVSVSRKIEGEITHGRVLAHELAHTLGSLHDTDSKNPEDLKKKYIMYPNGSTSNEFSPGSISSIKQIITERTSGSPSGLCNTEKYESVICGDGIVSNDEQCDAGPSGDECCNESCKFKSQRYNCSPRNKGLCCKNCLIQKQGTICRSSFDDCDKEEVCDQNGNCPFDRFKINGIECKIKEPMPIQNNVGICADGRCTNRRHQCHQKYPGTEFKGVMVGNCKLNCIFPNSTGVESFVKEGTICGIISFCFLGSCKLADFGTIWLHTKMHAASFSQVFLFIFFVSILMGSLMLLRGIYGTVVEQKYEEIVSKTVWIYKNNRIRHKKVRSKPSEETAASLT